VPVPDERFLWLVDLYKPKSQVPAFLTCIDIAGLTAGASTGAGLGNAFLSNVRSVDGIFQVIRAFDDAEVIHVEGDVNPIRDMEIISTELRLKDIEWVEKSIEAQKKLCRGATGLKKKQLDEELATMEKALKMLQEDSQDVRKGEWGNKEVSVRGLRTCRLAAALRRVMNKRALFETLESNNPARRGTINPYEKKILSDFEAPPPLCLCHATCSPAAC